MKRYKGYYYDYKVALHETGHFIFLIKSLVTELGRKRARKYIDSLSKGQIYIHMERRSKNRAAFFKTNDKKINTLLSKNSLFMFCAGGVAVDLKTKRKGKFGLTIEESLYKNLREYEKLLLDNRKTFLKIPNQDYKNSMVALINTGKFLGARETFKAIHQLKNSITTKEWQVMKNIAENIMQTLEVEDSVELDLQKWAKQLL